MFAIQERAHMQQGIPILSYPLKHGLYVLQIIIHLF